MASPMVLAGKKRTGLARLVDVQRVSKPQLSLLILVATALVIALVLLVWLLLWLWREKVGIDGWWIAQRGLTAPVVGHQADDLRRVVKPAGKSPADIVDRAFEQALRGRLEAAGRRPIVVYLSAVGVADDQGAFLLRPEPGSLQAFAPAGERQGLVTPERLVELFARSPSSKKLLILDAAQVGSDRNLGVFANGFVHRLQACLDARQEPGLVVLSSCAPGQASWASEADRSSVFGHFVARGLAGAASGWDPTGRGLTVRGLGRYVRHHVERWVGANRQSVQTPVLLGDPAVNFPLRASAPSRVPTAPLDAKETERLATLLEKAWDRRDALQKVRPYRHTPLQWRRYLETLLRSERLFRAGEYGEAEELLVQLPGMEKPIVDASGGLPWHRDWSLALLTRDLAAHPGDTRRAELKAANDRIDEALKELTVEGDEVVQPGDAEPGAEPSAPPAANAKADPAVKPDPAEKLPEVPAAERVVPAKRKEARPKARDRKSANQALAGLVDRIDKGRPIYVEGQLLVWADTFLKRSGAPYAFKGLRGELFDEAVRARRVAEDAAASDERIGRWIVPLVEAGDDLRRRAQDGLFVGGTETLESLRALLGEAQGLDRQALEDAERYAAALDLVEEIEADLPYYGEWMARQPGRRDEGLDPEILALMAAGTRLARLIQVDQAGRRPVPEKADEVPEAARERIKEWEATYRETKDGWERLLHRFADEATGLATAGGSGRWREIDRLLGVPLIPAVVRRDLLRRVQALSLASSLSGPEDGASIATEPVSAPTDFNSYARQKAEKAVASTRAGGREEIPDRAAADAPAAADPEFWNQALALARLDWGLLDLGGASESDLSRLETTFTTARNAIKGEPAAAFEAFERLSHLIRTCRSERFKAIQQGHETTTGPIAAADRAVRVLPLVEALGASDTITTTLDRYRRQALLLWHGRRLLRDFAPEHALRLFEDARQYLDTDALREARNEAEAMSLARLRVVPAADGDLVVKEWNEQELDVEVATTGGVPAGDAVVFVGYDAAQPLAVTEKATHRAAREGILVPVVPNRRIQSVAYQVRRSESTAEPLTITLSPGVYYRGRFFPAERGVDVAMEPAHDPVSVTIAQSYEGIAFKDFTNQFKEHPGQGFLHYRTDLKYKLLLKADRPMQVVVRYGLVEHPDKYKTETRKIEPQHPAEIHDWVRGNDFQIVKVSDLIEISPLTLQVTVFKDRENGEVQAKVRYPFRMIPPSQYISVVSNYDPGPRLLYLDVVHLQNDPVTGPVRVFASIGGSVFQGVIRRSQFYEFVFWIPPALKKVTWHVGVETMPSAFHEEVDTPSPQAEPPPEKPPAL